ncbi:MAG TPA: hypothetical protein VKC51_08195 [Lacunisphaera sp.]|jgi:hypothetical protein|nr:hypothetical protein [Lacunisphaera sp.]
MESVAFFDVPLNLPHAGRIARRLLTVLHSDGHDKAAAGDTAEKLLVLLDPYFESEENPRPDAAARVRNQAAVLGRQFVDQVELDKLGHDRLGQCVRNLFECLELGREGAALSLRAGEDPGSMQRPR